MAARTGWGDDSVIAEMKTNIYNFSGHEHADGGDFAIYYKGPLAVHSGIYQGTNGGFKGTHQKSYYHRTIAHNTLLIYDPKENMGGRLDNDGGQRALQEPKTLDELLSGTKYRTGAVLGEGFGPDPRKPEYTYLKSDITAAYSDKVKEVKRSFVFLNLSGKGEPAALIVFDRVVSAKPEFTKYWLLQSVKAPSVSGNTSTLSLSGGEPGWSGKLVNSVLLPEPENALVSTVGGPGKEFYGLSKNYPEAKVPPDPEAGGWRVQISPKIPAATDLFLNVMQIMDGDARPLMVEKIASGETVGVRILDRVVLFNTGGGRTSGPVSFAAPEGNHRFLVTDLAEGTWQVWRDGRIEEPAMVVSGDAGTLYFEGPGGSYTLRR
jgi:heparin/heparan-sulfate lyase